MMKFFFFFFCGLVNDNNSQHWWMLHVASVCTPCRIVVVETTQTFQPTTPNISFVSWSPKRGATMLDPFAQLFQHCWGHARSLRMDYKDLWVVFLPRCTAGPKLAGSCCIRLHTTANTHAITPKIVGPTMLGVVAPVCTQPNILEIRRKNEDWIEFMAKLSTALLERLFFRVEPLALPTEKPPH